MHCERHFPAGQRRRGEEKRPHALRVSQGKVDRDAAAEGVRDQARFRDPEVVEERAEVVDVGEGPARERRLAVAAQVEADDEVALGERLDLVVPEAPVAYARVQEDDGRVFGRARRVVGDLGAVEACPAQLSSACCASR
jgi:hypothetical protein